LRAVQKCHLWHNCTVYSNRYFPSEMVAKNCMGLGATDSNGLQLEVENHFSFLSVKCSLKYGPPHVSIGSVVTSKTPVFTFQ
jgi:hypothetical protein